MRRITRRRDYRGLFDGREAAALAQALDTRKLEIQLSWERTKYFATLIGASVAVYGVVLSAKRFDGQDFMLSLLACVGLVLSVAWYLVNRGSKYWQENWERHVDLLEDHIQGPLHKTVLAEDHYSVSGVNLWVSRYVSIIWTGLIVKEWPARFPPEDVESHLFWALMIVTAAVLVLMTTEWGARWEPRPAPDFDTPDARIVKPRATSR
ncbi:MAG: hypothetical protein AB7G21_13585 [Dehalococcoidia bacterium]